MSNPKPQQPVLIDGTNLIHRCYSAVKGANPDEPSLEVVERTVMSMTMRLLDQWHAGPSMVTFALDDGDGGRKAIDKTYKAHRDHSHQPVLREALTLIPMQLHRQGLTVIYGDGYEADDVLATLTQQAIDAERPVVVVSSDKDMFQLLDGDPTHSLVTIHLLGSRSGQYHDWQNWEFYQHYGFGPELWASHNALVGESGDNITGAMWVGTKSAGKLLAEYGGLKNIFYNLNNIKPERVRESLREAEQRVMTNLQLCTLHRDVPKVQLAEPALA